MCASAILDMYVHGNGQEVPTGWSQRHAKGGQLAIDDILASKCCKQDGTAFQRKNEDA